MHGSNRLGLGCTALSRRFFARGSTAHATASIAFLRLSAGGRNRHPVRRRAYRGGDRYPVEKVDGLAAPGVDAALSPFPPPGFGRFLIPRSGG